MRPVNRHTRGEKLKTELHNIAPPASVSALYAYGCTKAFAHGGSASVARVVQKEAEHVLHLLVPGRGRVCHYALTFT